MLVKCSICGLPLEAGRRRYCSPDCARDGHNAKRRRRSPARRRCRRCGSKFRPSRRGQLYCSGACRQSAYRERLRERIARLANFNASVFLREDITNVIGRDLSEEAVSPKHRRELDSDQTAVEQARVRKELADLGMDPRPARKAGRAVKEPRNPRSPEQA